MLTEETISQELQDEWDRLQKLFALRRVSKALVVTVEDVESAFSDCSGEAE